MTTRVFFGGVNLLDAAGQYSSSHNAEFAKSPYSVGYQSVPLGLLYLASAQRAFGKTATVQTLFDFNMPGERFDLEEVFRRYERALRDFRPDVVALGCLTQRQNPHLERAVAAARAYAQGRRPRPRIIAGGAAASNEPERFLRAGADAVCLGEGELTFAEFVDCAAGGGELERVAGLALPGFGGEARRTAARAPVDDLDRLPMPAWDLADVRGYIERNHGVFSPVLTQRGCPYECIYCDHQRRFRAHGPRRVVDEFETLQHKYGARRLDIVDEIFNCRKDRVLAIRDEKKRRGVTVQLQDFDGLRADILDEETIDALKEMGFFGFSVAIESAVPRVQELIRKRLKLDRVLRAVDYSVSKGLFVNAFFMVGFPTETREEVRATLTLAKDCASHQSVISKVEAYPGTPMWELARRHGLETETFRSEFIERYGPRRDPGFLAFPETEFDALWTRGVFEVYNEPRRMKRICELVSPLFFRQMYEKFYREHGVWDGRFAAAFERLVARGPAFEALSRQAAARFAA